MVGWLVRLASSRAYLRGGKRKNCDWRRRREEVGDSRGHVVLKRPTEVIRSLSLYFHIIWIQNREVLCSYGGRTTNNTR